MANTNPFVKNIMDAIVPISRFNRGEASKIFDEVGESGVKIVLKNNVPVGVLVAPEQYEKMVEMLENYALFFEAEKRMNNAGAGSAIPQQQVLDSLDISEADLDDTDVDID